MASPHSIPGDDFHNLFWAQANLGEAGRYGSHRYEFTGARGWLTKRHRLPKIIPVNGKPNCYCVEKGTGIAYYKMRWKGTKAGKPDVNDLPDDEKKKFEWYNKNGWKIFDVDLVPLSQAGADYANWHEETECSLIKQLSDLTIKIAEDRVKEFQCDKNGLKNISKKALEDYIRWDLAKSTFDQNMIAGRKAFDNKFGIQPVGRSLTPRSPKESYNPSDFDKWYKPDIWGDK